MIKMRVNIIFFVISVNFMFSFDYDSLLVQNVYHNEPYENYKINKNYTPKKILSNQIILDGKLDDDIWFKLKKINGLEQAEPIINGIPSEITEVKICYDDSYLYIGVFLEHSLNNITYKNGSDDDFFGVFDLKSDYFILEFDTHHDHQTGYGFAVNSSGVKSDYMIYNDTQIDDNWDAQWDAQVFSSDLGWSIEYKIPFKNLRLNYGENLTWGMNLVRYIKSLNEYISWVVVPIEKIGIVSKYGHLENMVIKHKKSIQFNPYLLFGNSSYDDLFYQITITEDNDIDLASDTTKFNKKFKQNNIGFNLRYASSPNATFDYTYNPDFGEINQDPSEVNNSPYETLFKEKRDFFLEDGLFFKTPIRVFYSRRIGGIERYNDLDPFSFFQTKLNHAAKYTFKDDKLSYGLILAKSIPKNLREDDDIYSQNLYNIQSSVFRLSHLIINNKSKIGIIGTDYKTEHDNNNVYGYDYSFNFLNNKLFLDGQFINSKDKNKTGFGKNLEIGYRSDIFTFINKNLFIDFWYKNNKYNRELDINNLGYLFRNNLYEQNLGLTINNSNDYIESKYVLQYYKAENYSNDILSDIVSFNYDLIINDFSYLNIGYSKEYDHYNDKFYDDYFNLDLQKTIKKPNNQTLNVTYGNAISDLLEYSISMKKFINDIEDKGQEYIAEVALKPNHWLEIDFTYDLLSYYETYHFLKISQPAGSHYIPTNKIFNDNIRLDEFQYIFTNSNNKEIYYTAQLAASTNNFTFKLYAEYFVHEDLWVENSNQYYVDQNFINYNFPTVDETNSLIEDNDYLLYTAFYSSAVANFVFKWDFNNNSNIYLLYSLNKGVNGNKINSLKELIRFKESDININSPSEIYYDNSLFIKCEFYFNS